MTHLLDSSAILTHFFGEPGADQVSALLAQGPEVVALAAPSWPEIERRLAELIPDATEAHRIWRLYTQSLCGLVPVDASAALAAISLRQATPERIPLIDALIAGCAKARGLILVHRDRHLAAIPDTMLKTLRLPERAEA